MHPFFQQFVARQLAAGAPDAAGTDARVRLPVRQTVLNDFLRDVVVPSQPVLRELRIAIGANNRLDVTVVSPSIPFVGRVTLPCLLGPILIVDPAPAVRIRIAREGVAGVASAFLPLVSRFLPPDVTYADGTLTVHLGPQIARRGFGWAVPFIKSGSFESEPGILWVTVHVHVDERART